MMNLRIEKIKAILEKTEGISDFRINAVKRESNELFFVHRSLETVRATDTADIKVTVYVSHDGSLGDATFSVYASYGEERIRSEIEAAKKKASLISNESYELPCGGTEAFDSESNFKNYDPVSLAAEISDAVFSADTYDNGSINALEIFIYRDTVRVLNSKGIDKTAIKYSAMIEAIPTWGENGESVELYEAYNFTEYDRETVRAEIDSRMREVRDRMKAKAPEEKLSCPVVLTEHELGSLIGQLSAELSYAKMYNHSNAFSVGDDIQKDAAGDKLTVTMCGQIKGSVASAAFDEDGFTLTDKRIIENGKAIDNFGPVRYASYLSKAPTGNLRCISAEAGTLADSELNTGCYLKCVSMSGLQLDIYNDYIGGEVRLAYYFDGEREIPVTGISISGKLSSALSGMRLSSDTAVYERYRGPKLALFSDIEIV